MEPGFSKEWLQVWVLKPGQAQVLAPGFYLGTSHSRALFSFLKYMSELSITSQKEEFTVKDKPVASLLPK